VKIAVEIAFSFKRELDETYRSLELSVGATVRDAFQVLATRYDVFRERVFNAHGEIRRNINALVNGGNIQFKEGFDTMLCAGDRLSVLPPVGGG